MLISWSQYFTAQFRQTSFLIYVTLFSVVQQPNSDLDHLIVEVSRSHTIRHRDTHARAQLVSSKQVISPPQRPMKHTTNTRDKHPCPQHDLNPQSQESSGCMSEHKTTWPLRLASTVVRKLNYCLEQLSYN